MHKTALLFLCLLLISGCIISEQAFQYSDVSSPCSVVYSGEVRAMYGFRAIEEKSFAKEDEYSFCLYSGQTSSNRSNLFTRHQLMLMYVPLAQNMSSLMDNYNFSNATEGSFISERDLGIGEYSFLAIHFEQDTGKIKHMSVVVMVNDSAIIATDAGYQLSGVDQKNKEKLKQLAALALQRVTS
jgi:hypothetical protein